MTTATPLIKDKIANQTAFVDLQSAEIIAKRIVSTNLSRRRNSYDVEKLTKIIIVLIARRCELTDTTSVSRKIDLNLRSQGPVVTPFIEMLAKHLPLGGSIRVKDRLLKYQLHPHDLEQVEDWLDKGIFAQALQDLFQFIQANDILACDLTFPKGHTPSLSLRYCEYVNNDEFTTIPASVRSLTKLISVLQTKEQKTKDGNVEITQEMVDREVRKYDYETDVEDYRVRNSSDSTEIRTVAQGHSILFPLFIFVNKDDLDRPDGLDIQLGTVISIKHEDTSEYVSMVDVGYQFVIKDSINLNSQYDQGVPKRDGGIPHYPKVEVPAHGMPPKGLNPERQAPPESIDPAPAPIGQPFQDGKQPKQQPNQARDPGLNKPNRRRRGPKPPQSLPNDSSSLDRNQLNKLVLGSVQHILTSLGYSIK